MTSTHKEPSPRYHKVTPPASTDNEPVRCCVVQRVPPSNLRPWTGMPSYNSLRTREDTDIVELKRTGRELGHSIVGVQFTMFKVYNELKRHQIHDLYPPCAPNVDIDWSRRLSDRERLMDGFLQTLHCYDGWCQQTKQKLKRHLESKGRDVEQEWEDIMTEVDREQGGSGSGSSTDTYNRERPKSVLAETYEGDLENNADGEVGTADSVFGGF